MGGLFGGGKSKTREVTHEASPPVDMSGASTPGDDKTALRKLETMTANKQAKAGQTLLGRTANDASAGTSKPTTVSYA